MRRSHSSHVSLLCLFGAMAWAGPGATVWGDEALEVTIGAAWDSAYVSEGRDNLGEGGMVSASVDVAWREFSLSGWTAHGDSVNYVEHNLSAGYALRLGSVEMAVSYTRLEFRGEGEAAGDNEFGLGCSVPVPGAIELAASVRYSTEAEGAFAEVFVRRPVELGHAGVVVVPYVMFGFDYGYATSEHDGANHTEGGIALDCPLGDCATLSFYVARCWAGRDVKLEGGDDVTWGGVSIAFGF